MSWAQLDPVWYKSNRNFTPTVSTVYLLTILIIVFVPQGMNFIIVTRYSDSICPSCLALPLLTSQSVMLRGFCFFACNPPDVVVVKISGKYDCRNVDNKPNSMHHSILYL